MQKEEYPSRLQLEYALFSCRKRPKVLPPIRKQVTERMTCQEQRVPVTTLQLDQEPVLTWQISVLRHKASSKLSARTHSRHSHAEAAKIFTLYPILVISLSLYPFSEQTFGPLQKHVNIARTRCYKRKGRNLTARSDYSDYRVKRSAHFKLSTST